MVNAIWEVSTAMSCSTVPNASALRWTPRATYNTHHSYVQEMGQDIFCVQPFVQYCTINS